jgi:hypothetical protein
VTTNLEMIVYSAASVEKTPGPAGGFEALHLSHPRTRQRERQAQRFTSVRHAQRFLSTYSQIHNHFQIRRHRLTASDDRPARVLADAPGATSPELRPPREFRPTSSFTPSVRRQADNPLADGLQILCTG